MSEYESEIIRKRINVYGRVQGVGFRYRATHAADLFGVTGWVRNEADGSVTMELQGTENQMDRVLQAIERGTYVQIERLSAKRIPLEDGEYSFKVREASDNFGYWHS